MPKLLLLVFFTITFLNCSSAKVTLKDGRVVKGLITSGDETHLNVNSPSLCNLELKKDSIQSVKHPGYGLAIAGGAIMVFALTITVPAPDPEGPGPVTSYKGIGMFYLVIGGAMTAVSISNRMKSINNMNYDPKEDDRLSY